MFGRTLMLAAITRIVEVCYFVPSYATLVDPDDISEDTLADGIPPSRGMSSRSAGAKAWQHLPPFVSLIHCTFICRLPLIYTSCLSHPGEFHDTYRTPFDAQQSRADYFSCRQPMNNYNSYRVTEWITSPTSSSSTGKSLFVWSIVHRIHFFIENAVLHSYYTCLSYSSLTCT